MFFNKKGLMIFPSDLVITVHLLCEDNLFSLAFFLFFLSSFALDAERRDRPGFQALDVNFAAAGFTNAVVPVVDPCNGFIDFLQELLLPAAELQQKIVIQLSNCLIRGIRKTFLFRADLAVQRLFRFGKKLLALLEELLPDRLQFCFSYGHDNLRMRIRKTR